MPGCQPELWETRVPRSSSYSTSRKAEKPSKEASRSDRSTDHKEKVSCSVCGKVGHRQEQCWHRLESGTENSSQAPRHLSVFCVGRLAIKV